MDTTVNPVPDSAPSRWTCCAYAGLLLLAGLVLLGGDAMLAWLGGSPYYVAAGLLAALSGALIWQRDRRGLWLCGALLAGTVAWAVWEVGFDPWLLMARKRSKLTRRQRCSFMVHLTTQCQEFTDRG